MWKKLTTGRLGDLFRSTAIKSEPREKQGRMKLIVGLGNPGREYADSRHNLGFKCINLFAKKQGIELKKQQSKARVGFGQIGDKKVIMAKPRTYMNLSGESVAPLARFYKIDPPDILIIHDDVDLPLGKIRIREKGSPAGHNGLKSIVQHLGTQDFPRLKVGIGTLQANDSEVSMRTPEYVLGRFTNKEKSIIAEVCSQVADAVDCILVEGITTAMNKYNAG